MYLLDSVTLRLILGSLQNVRTNLIRSRKIGRIFLSSIAAEEAVLGRLAMIRRAQAGDGKLTIGAAHEFLCQTLRDLNAFDLLPYSNEDEIIFRSMAPALRRNGSQDCRIAAQAIHRGYIVVTQNIAHFQESGARYEDWSTG